MERESAHAVTFRPACKQGLTLSKKVHFFIFVITRSNLMLTDSSNI